MLSSNRCLKDNWGFFFLFRKKWAGGATKPRILCGASQWRNSRGAASVRQGFLVLEGAEQRCPAKRLWTSAHAKTSEWTYLFLHQKHARVLPVMVCLALPSPRLVTNKKGLELWGLVFDACQHHLVLSFSSVGSLHTFHRTHRISSGA